MFGFAGRIFSGRISGKIVDAAAKATYLKKIAAEHGWSLNEIVSVGDGANDIEMSKVAGLAIGFRPKKILHDYIVGAFDHHEQLSDFLIGSR